MPRTSQETVQFKFDLTLILRDTDASWAMGIQLFVIWKYPGRVWNKSVIPVMHLIKIYGRTSSGYISHWIKTVNPISAGVFENQDMRGGGQFDPPFKSHVWFPNMTNDTSLESSCALLLESRKKICKFAKIEFFIAKSSYVVKIFAKKNVFKKWKKIYIFEKPSTMPF